ncbi:hypothetical protein JOC54_002070 [Alkalihalobacillus xiaoxiensis]|uniref:Uncharacterized protein n=1 Tax=Shouchella xiaoxiensis TaxID=766895 RepID=A0ABS2SUW3_9BACI|nr:hypothetical protein [Shouchella xiaoxiensis]
MEYVGGGTIVVGVYSKGYQEQVSDVFVLDVEK